MADAGGEKGQATWMLTRLGLSVFLSMGVMVFSLALYSRDIYGVEPSEASPLAQSLFGLMRYLLLLLATPVFLMLGWPILVNAWRQLRAGIASTDALIVLGVAAAFGHSYVSTLTGRGAVYYETACMILVLVTLGRYLEAVGKLKASAAVESLAGLIPDAVSIRRGDDERTVPAGEVLVGDVVLVPAGQGIPVDGIVETGDAQVDEQILTGESAAVRKSAGDLVHAGSVAVDGALTLRATAVGSNSAIGRLAALLEKAKQSKGRYERLADRVVRLFLPGIVVLALSSAFLGYQRDGTDEAIMTGLAVMLIACPCALGLATPMAIWVSLGRAAAHGLLFRDGESIERLARVRAIAFDKTGTLTTGEPAVTFFVADSRDPDVQRGALEWAAGLAVTSTHALSRSLVAFARRAGVGPRAVPEARTLPGRGIIGEVNGSTLRLGSQAFMMETSARFETAVADAVNRALAADQPLSCLSVDGDVVGVFGFSETLRAEAKHALSSLARAGYTVRILTGDHRRRGQRIARELGVETLAEQTPEDKVASLAWMRAESGPVAMVGDGLNDAPALAAADVGIAMGCGADLTRESASVCLLGDDLEALPHALNLARHTVRTIKLNLFWAFFYNLIGISLAMAGRLNPIIAAGAMVASSLLVISNSLRLRSAGFRHATGQPAESSLALSAATRSNRS